VIEGAAHATTFDRLPRVRLNDDRRSAVCFDADCGTVFARRVEPPEGPPQHAYLLFEPGWIYQGSIWRSRPTEEGMSARQLESTIRATTWLRELSPSHKRREPDWREKLVQSSLPAFVLCPACRYNQIAEPQLLLATEARASLGDSPA